jgi:hypothetical protein
MLAGLELGTVLFRLQPRLADTTVNTVTRQHLDVPARGLGLNPVQRLLTIMVQRKDAEVGILMRWRGIAVDPTFKDSD